MRRANPRALREVPRQGEWSEDPLVIRVIPKEITRSGRAVSKSHKIGHILALDPPVGGTLCSSDERRTEGLCSSMMQEQERLWRVAGGSNRR